MQTREKILDAAYQCFMQFGFSASSIVMIGKYADLSRFTVHKYFKNKEELFQAVVINHGQTTMEEIAKILGEQRDEHVWDTISNITDAWFSPIFEQIKDQLVFEDLRMASEKYLTCIHSTHHEFLKKTFITLLTEANKKGEIDLSRLGATEVQIADFIVTSIDCIKHGVDIKQIPVYIEQLIRVYSVATEKYPSH